MNLQTLRNLGGRHRMMLRAGLMAVLALAVYVPLLLSAEQDAAQRLDHLRGEDPQAYLRVLKREEGFDAYLDAYAEMQGYDDWRAAPPGFLQGRWRLYDTRQHVNDSFRASRCTPAVRFAEGSVRMTGTAETDALYSIRDGEIAVQRATARTFYIAPIVPVQAVQYLRIEGMPEGLRFAYRCE